MEKNDTKYESYECQRCGEPIGWLGRFIEWVSFEMIVHNCNSKV